MLTALNCYNQLVVGIDNRPTDGPFRCPECGETVFHRAPRDRVWHFYHQVDRQCGYESSESPTHYDCKIRIFRSLREHYKVSYCMPEFKIGNRRADLYAIIADQPVAIEIQNSDIHRQEIQAKLEHYTATGVSCLYLLPHSIPQGNLQAVEWKRYLHAMYMQNLYYWAPTGKLRDGRIVMDNAQVRILHMGSYKDYPQPGNWTERHLLQPRPIFDTRQSISICDFAPLMRHRDELRSRYLGITDALLWQHQLDDWWTTKSDFEWQLPQLQFAA